ncbi:MAG TPA: class I SAM-dependent methyltransferase [Luteimonas sp.]|nr:class I SAM-dependent methyltransferase [Luteimonas sp.]
MSRLLERFSGFEDWQRHRVAHADELREEFLAEERLAQTLAPVGLHGHCSLCGHPRWFRAPGASPRSPVSLRESLSCEACSANARQRCMAQVLFESTDVGRASVYMTEQASNVFIQLRRHCRRLVGSEFVRSWRQRLRLSLWLMHQGGPRWVRCEDVTALSFRDRAFDAIVTMDVLEHVPDYRRALAEFVRVLRPGGVLLLTVPFYSDHPRSTMLATVAADGSIDYLQPPEYHGDPVSDGALCFHHFGWDLLDAMRVAGFSNAEALRVRDVALGIPQAQWVLRATR